jgi:hypothetical protein
MADAMTATVLPKELLLGVPAKMPQARSYMFRQQSTLQSYTYNNTITINFPRLQRSYLRKDSYLRFRLNGYFTPQDTAQSLVLDTSGAWGLFEKLEVFDYLGSTVLETISGKPQLMSLLLDLGLKEIIDKNIGTAVCGLESDYTTNGDLPFGSVVGSNGTTADIPLNNTTVTQAGTVRPPNSGTILIPGLTRTNPLSATYTAATPSVFTVASGTYPAGSTVVITSQSAGSFAVGTTYYVASSPAPTSTSFSLAASRSTLSTALAAGSAGTGVTIQVSPAPSQTNFSREFSIPLLSFLGMLSQKMVPLHNGFSIVLTVASQKKPMYLSQPVQPVIPVGANGATSTVGYIRTATTTTEPTPPEWNITDVYLQAQILELGPIAESMVLSSSQGNPLVVHTKTFRNYVSTVKGSTWSSGAVTSTGQQEFVANLNLNVMSLTNVLWMMRPSNQTDSLLYPSCGARTRNFLQRWSFQYGSTSLPQNNGIQAMSATAPTFPSGAAASTANSTYIGYLVGFTECFQELMKARPFYLPASRFHLDGYPIDNSFNTNLDLKTSVTLPSVNWKNLFPSKDSWQSLPRFAAGLNLQLMNGKDFEMISGLNTNGMNTSIRGIFNPLYTDFMNNVTVDAYCEYDAFVNISPGIATTVSF